MMLDVTSQKTERAINKAVDSFRVMLEKHRPEFPYQAFLRGIDSPGFARDQIAVLRRYVEGEIGVVVRHFKVDRTKTPRQLLDACKRVLWRIDDEVLSSMPTDGPEEGELVFFPLGRDMLVAEIPKVFEDRGLVPDYSAQMQVNIDDPAFAEDHPNGMQWGSDFYALFLNHQLRDPEVSVRRREGGWSHNYWFAGRRKT